MTALAAAMLGQMDAEDAREAAAGGWVGLYVCGVTEGRNARWGAHVLMHDEQWRDAHRRMRGLTLALRRRMTVAELKEAADRPRLMSVKYESLLGLVQDEGRIGGVQWAGRVLVAFKNALPGWDEAAAWVRECVRKGGCE